MQKWNNIINHKKEYVNFEHHGLVKRELDFLI